MIKENITYTGIVPFFKMKSLTFDNKICPVQFNMYGCPILDNLEDIKLVVDYIYETEKNFNYISFRNFYKEDYFPYLDNYYYKNTFDLYTTEVNIKLSYAKCVSRYQQQYRAKIRQLKRNKKLMVSSILFNEIDIIYKLSVEFFKNRFGLTSYPKWYFKELYRTVIEKGYGDFLVVKLNGKIIGCAIFLRYQKRVVESWTCYDRKYLQFSPTALLIDYIIEKYSDSGYEILDLGHTSPENKGLLKYKGKFGGIHKKLTHLYISRNRKNIEKLSNNEQFGLIRKIIKHSPIILAYLLTPAIFKLYRK